MASSSRRRLLMLTAAFLVAVVVVPAAAASVISTSDTGTANDSKSGELGKVGDPLRCIQLAAREGRKLRRFDVLPGSGWDNLRNMEQGGSVFSLTFSGCQTTDDGRFLLPDSVHVVPVLSSSVETSAELIEDMRDWQSSTSASINLEAGLSGILEDVLFGVGGSFSAEFQETKSMQMSEDSVTTRAQVRYVRYEMQLQPNTPLHPVFRGRLLDIAAAHQLQETEQARHLAQLLVRDFGTHAITGVKAGAALVKTDHLSRKWVEGQETTVLKLAVKQSASFDFLGLLGARESFSAALNHYQSASEDYSKQTTSSSIRSLGGPVYRPNNFTVDMWAKQVDDSRNLVALDRTGAPLHDFVTVMALPELPVSVVREVAQTLQQAVEMYYTFNAIPGCLDIKSPNFSPSANYDDGSCQPPPTNSSFGGVFQTCEMTSSDNGDICSGMKQVNPLTGQPSCPPNYRQVPLHQGTFSTSRTEHQCHHVLFVKYHCRDVTYRSTATYSISWCAAERPVGRESGYLFGGFYTPRVANFVTQGKACPPSFEELKVGSARDLRICVTSDQEDAVSDAFAAPFGGLFSCNAGNPLAASGNQGQGSGPWPQRCPDGFSKHLAAVDDGCEISYCTHTGSLKQPHLPRVKRPPFTRAPEVRPVPEDNLVVFDRVSRSWYRNEEALEYMAMLQLQPAAAAAAGNMAASNMSGAWSFLNAYNMSAAAHFFVNPSDIGSSAREAFRTKESRQTADASRMSSSEEDPRPMSAGSVAGLAVVATLATLFLVAVVALAGRAYRRRRRAEYRSLEEPVDVPHAQYGAE